MVFEECKRAGLSQPTETDERGVVKVTFMRPNLSGHPYDPINDPINDTLNDTLNDTINDTLNDTINDNSIFRKKITEYGFYFVNLQSTIIFNKNANEICCNKLQRLCQSY